MSQRRTTATLTAVLLIGAALRLVGLNNVSPPGLAHDEVANWLIDRSILAGNHAIYFTRAYGHEAGFHYIQAAFVGLLGDHALALRLPAAFAGLLGVAVCYALVRQLFGRETAVLAAALCATLFWPVFYSRLALRAILLPVTAGLSAYFWWRAWPMNNEQLVMNNEQFPITSSQLLITHYSLLIPFLLSGLFAGLSLHVYPAARALPIFYGAWLGYLALTRWPELKQRWRGVLGFTAVFALVAAPLFIYLANNPGAEFRVAEVSLPLDALRAGDWRPIWQNVWRIGRMFGLAGDPLWRQNVAGVPVFEPIGALLFYGGVLLTLWRWRDGRYAFLLLWLATAALPSVVTINAPSTIRMMMALPLLTAFPLLFIHNIPKLSTVFATLSTGGSQIRGLLLLTIGLVYGWRTAHLTFNVWPSGGDVPFVWQAALTETAATLNDQPQPIPVSLGGWSPDTMDANTMTLLQRNPQPISHFNPQDGTLVLPAAEVGTAVTIIHPTVLPLATEWPDRLAGWGAAQTLGAETTRYTLPLPSLDPMFPADVLLGEQMRFLGVDRVADGIVSYWRVVQRPLQPLRLFVQVVDGDGNLLAEDYRLDNLDPQGLWFPHWQPGDLILQHHPLPLDGAATLRLGFFDPYTCNPGPCQNLLTETGKAFVTLSIP